MNEEQKAILFKQLIMWCIGIALFAMYVISRPEPDTPVEEQKAAAKCEAAGGEWSKRLEMCMLGNDI